MNIKPALFWREPNFVIRCGDSWLSLLFDGATLPALRFRGQAALADFHGRACEALRRSHDEEDFTLRHVNYNLHWSKKEFFIDLPGTTCRISEGLLLELHAWFGHVHGEDFSLDDNLKNISLKLDNGELVIDSDLWVDRVFLTGNHAASLATELLALAGEEARARQDKQFGSYQNYLTTRMSVYGHCHLETRVNDTILILTRSSAARLGLAILAKLDEGGLP